MATLPTFPGLFGLLTGVVVDPKSILFVGFEK